MTQGFNSKHVWQSNGRGFSMGYVQPRGRVVHFTGQVAWDVDENIVGIGNVEEQTRQCFRNIKLLLNEVGGNLEDMVEVTTYFLNYDDLEKIQVVRNEILSGISPPASTSIRVAGLGHPDFLVELTPIAVVPFNRFRSPIGAV